MIEDDDSKIRRNLLVFSVLVILAEWFGLQPGELAVQVFKLDSKLDPLKLCAAALATLVYLALRYKDAHLLESKTYREVVDADLAVITPTVAYHYTQFMANLYSLTGLEASIFLNHLRTYVKQQASGMGMTPEALATRPRIWLSLNLQDEAGQLKSIPSAGPWEMGTTLAWSHGQFRATTSGGTMLAVEARGIHRYLIWFYSRGWWFFFCEAAVRVRFPVLFGLCAIAILCWKISLLLAVR
jgi:hypothetical protein